MELSKLRARMGTRKLAGVDIPRQNRTSVAFRKAMSADGGDHDGISGGSSHRLCRASGGRVKKREDGGVTESSNPKAPERAEQTKPPQSAPVETSKMKAEAPGEKSNDEQRRYLSNKGMQERKTAKRERTMETIGRVVSVLPKQGMALRTVNTMNANDSGKKATAATQKAEKFENEADKFSKGGAAKKGGK